MAERRDDDGSMHIDRGSLNKEGSVLKDLVSTTPLSMEEREVEGASDLTSFKVDDEGKLIFDRSIVDEKERKAVDSFLEAYDSGTFRESIFGKLFEDQTQEFIDELARFLRARRDNQSYDVQKLNLQDIEKGAAALREQAKREEIRKALGEFAKRLPFAGFEATLNDGSTRELSFDPNNLNNPNNAIQFVYTSNNGRPEVLILCKTDPKDENGKVIATEEISQISPMVLKEEDWQKKGTFAISGYSEGKGDFAHLEIDIVSGSSDIPPISPKIRVGWDPVDFGGEMQKLEDENQKKADEEAKRKQNVINQAPTYKPQPPAASSPPTVPKHQQQTNFVTSG